MEDQSPKSALSPLAQSLVNAFYKDPQTLIHAEGIKVNPIVSEVATWFEKVRNAMDYKEDEVVLRSAIERILRRRFIFGGDERTIAAPLVRELIWARYFPDESIPESVIGEVTQIITTYVTLRTETAKLKVIPEGELNNLIYQLMSSQIALMLSKNPKKEVMTNFVYHMIKNNVSIVDADNKTRDIQVYIAVRKAFAKDDMAFLKYRLFTQYFGAITPQSIANISQHFKLGYDELTKQLHYQKRHKIFSYVKKQIPPFLILEDILLENQSTLKDVFLNQGKLNEIVNEKCKRRYQDIRGKINRAIIRSVIFILMTKTFIALAIEGTYDNLVYGQIMWDVLLMNIFIPPVIMIVASFFIRIPEQKNTARILERLHSLLYDTNPQLGRPMVIKPDRKAATAMDILFSVLWFFGFFISFGIILLALKGLGFSIVGMAIFMFFLTIVAFFIFRIYQIAHTYTVVSRQHFFTPIIDFLFMPIAQVGRYLAEGVSQVNIFLFIFDFLIETPFKTMFGFAEEWFHYLHTKREYLE